MSSRTIEILEKYKNEWRETKSQLRFWDFVQFKRTGSVFFDMIKQKCSSDEIDLLCFKHAQGQF